jgi:hypothetical protein
VLVLITAAAAVLAPGALARVEAGLEGTDTRFIVTSLEGWPRQAPLPGLYCARGQAENQAARLAPLI